MVVSTALPCAYNNGTGIAMPSGHTITLAAGSLPSSLIGETLQFSVVYSAGDRNSTSYIRSILEGLITTVSGTLTPAETPKLPSGAWYANPSADFTLGSTVVVNETESSSARRLVLSGTPVLSYMWSADGGALNLSAPGVVSGSLVGDMLVIRAGVLSPGER